MTNKLTIVVVLFFVTAVFAGGHRNPPAKTGSAAFETRCGWFSNPTPANISLYDRDDEWTIGVQGGYQTPGDWPWPVFKRGQWVKTNTGSYGYGCACLQVRVNKQTQEVLEIKSSSGRLLSQCRQDASLKKWERMLN
jgi:hypothetical protein